MGNNIKQFEGRVICGDCIEVMKKIPENSVDTVITDPPYGIGFMGKEWDIMPRKVLWEEALRVAKPGATLLCFGGTRTYHKLACAIEDAGWILKDCMMWLYGSGFPKSLNIGKQLDKKAGKERKVVGKKETPSGQKYPEGYDKNSELFNRANADLTEPATPEAKLWDGWGTALKPAYEPIIVAMKPNEGTYAENALKYGVAGLNIDGGRIEGKPRTTHKNGNYSSVGERKDTKFNMGDKYKCPKPKGRFPANIILDEEAAKMLDEQSGESKSMANIKSDNRDNQGKSMFLDGVRNPANSYSDKGGASRFFYIAKASKAERNLGCEGLEEKQKVFNGQSAESSKDIKDVEKRFTTRPVANNHPTVKPIKLMEYLCLLTKTPTGGIVLDPFLGSGTTAIAAKKTGRQFIGIEKEGSYCEIARARIKAQAKPLL